MKQDYVTHSGTITHVTDSTLTLRTDGSCSCDGCAVASLCNKDSSDGGGESITIDTPIASRYSVGQRVEVIASSGSTLRATWWALLLPTILFVGVILGVRLIWPQSGAVSLVAGFATLAVYDLGLYLCRKKLAQKIIWTVRPV
ncbi:SoxR reducing system RseC family protein [Duncaniella muricolitica]|jgi:positive regulator of sigma E activity|uniref:SoxR reducing system RseC family protein n=1 Tax=Duncaniella muricolitica TaxID=2880704 RepID=UPI00244DF5F7|nr:SoxR reducing system RseC family protein [Duncaniella muricolitica]